MKNLNLFMAVTLLAGFTGAYAAEERPFTLQQQLDLTKMALTAKNAADDRSNSFAQTPEQQTCWNQQATYLGALASAATRNDANHIVENFASHAADCTKIFYAPRTATKPTVCSDPTTTPNPEEN